MLRSNGLGKSVIRNVDQKDMHHVYEHQRRTTKLLNLVKFTDRLPRTGKQETYKYHACVRAILQFF